MLSSATKPHADRVADVVTRARKRSNMTHGKEPEKTQQWYEELKHEDGTNILNAISKTILAGPLLRIKDGKTLTHVLDTAHGCPATSISLELCIDVQSGQKTLLKTILTNADGRTDHPC